jgi:hypothetical protein
VFWKVESSFSGVSLSEEPVLRFTDAVFLETRVCFPQSLSFCILLERCDFEVLNFIVLCCKLEEVVLDV